ncbi:fumarylacetoacetate hydrolase family protein [Bacillaceae bacterium SIJ1]|uniref:fumarylacetoacetate hydrolase family protein n=1 Tax=Litoribacterium kuwaitense TaxID=1398745 RepID=UPI0013EADA8C|nr:fumarylacetoacetate hydrolase family protein [Litoribacterium kuwaitense]NGP45451.1 fumarylacetoacetate hydrolase family protein [Litoribacterium kuwaitense]
MKLFTYHIDGSLHTGVRTDAGLLSLSATAANMPGSSVEVNMMDIVAGGQAALENVSTFVNKAIQDDKAVFLSEAEVVWGPCIPQPHKIICVGLNYRRHADETNAPYPETPILFNKFDNTLAGHLEDIPVPTVTEKLDYEVELTIVIGKNTKNVSEEEALDHVFGYCAANDLSARDLQMKTPQWLLGKTCDKFSPIGPDVVTADEVGNPQKLALKTIVNGEERQNSNTSDMIFSCKEIVSYISKHMTLVPGDIILTGTPEGVVLGSPEDEQVYLKPGDEVTVSIEKLGSLTNTFVAETE